MPGTILGAKDTTMNKNNNEQKQQNKKILPSWNLHATEKDKYICQMINALKKSESGSENKL